LSDLLVAADSDSVNGFLMLESAGSNGARPVWTSWWFANYGLGFGDFNLNGRMNFVGAVHSRVKVFENTGDNQYEITGNDITRNGKPEFFIPFFRGYGGDLFMVWLYMWESVGGNRYARVLVDSGFRQHPYPVGRSICGDLDGDGIQEVVWNTNQHVGVYDFVPLGEFERVGNWTNRHHQPMPGELAANIADVNYNGYNNLILAGDGKITILEVEAVRLLQPTGGELLNPGDTCRIAWQTFPRPHCDSVSLFLRTDSTYRLDTLATGLAPTESSYAWVVPDTVLDSVWVMVIAYGPGWQHDEHERPLRIGPAGVRETEAIAWKHWRPPTVLRSGFVVPEGISALLFDASGRKVMELQPGENDVRHLAPGVYFIRAEGQRVQGVEGSSQKVVIQR
jgi:hypothetical protein